MEMSGFFFADPENFELNCLIKLVDNFILSQYVYVSTSPTGTNPYLQSKKTKTKTELMSP